MEVDKEMQNGQAGFRQRRSFTCWLVTGRKLLYSITDQTCKWETSLCRRTLVKLDKYFSESLGIPTIQKLHAYDGFICLVIHWRIVTDNYQYQSETSWHTTLSPILVYDFFLCQTAAYQANSGHLSLGLIYDICSMFFRLQNSQHQTTILRTTAKQTDFCISAQKTRINLKQTVGINTKKEDAGLTFLGRIVGISEFTKKIINKGERRLNKLLPFWDQCEEAGRWEQLSTKLRMFNSKVKSVFKYESGAWRETLITSIHGIYWGKQTPISQSKP